MTESDRAAATLRWKAALTTVMAAASLHSLLLPAAVACECAPPPPPCQAFGHAQMVFLGTVTEALQTDQGRVVRARMRIDHAYKGVSEYSLILFDSGMCDGPDLRVGEQYLMYTHRIDGGNGDVPSRGCSRSRHVQYADEDLKYLSGLSEALPRASIFGNVLVRTDDYRGNDKPAAGAVVEVSGTAGTHTTTTDGEGGYSIGNLEPGEYSVAANLAGYRALTFGGGDERESARVEPRGCAVVNMILRRTWRGAIEGRIVRSSGEPAPAEIGLDLLQLEDRDGEQRSNPLFNAEVMTNERGEYAFPEVAPGRYKIVMNMYRFPTEENPYPTLYWPAAHVEADAAAIEVTDVPAQRRYDFRLPPEPEAARVEGIVVTADSKPVQGAQVYIDALPDMNIAPDNGNRPVTDADGRFSFTALEGFEYRLRATRFAAHSLHSGDLHFALDKKPQSITILLDRPGRFDHDPIAR